MNEFDQQNSSSEGAEPLQIANLDCEEPRRRRRVEPKVIWFVDPSYQGLVLVRGHQIDGPHSMNFDGGLSSRPLAPQLVIDTTISGSPWPNMGSYTRLQAPGCYVYQVDGATFSYAIVFQVVVQN